MRKANQSKLLAMKVCVQRFQHLIVKVLNAVAGLNVGDLVRVKGSVSRPVFGWGDVNHTSIGPLHSFDEDRPDQVLVDFPEQAGWRGLTSELEVVVDDSKGLLKAFEKN